MFKKYFVGDMCAPYRKKITPNQDRVRTRAALLIWRGLEGVTCVYGIRSGRHSNPMLPCQGMFMGESLFHFYSILRLMRSEIYARFRARIFSWPWFANEKTMENYPCDLCNPNDTNSPEKIPSSAIVGEKYSILYKISCITLESSIILMLHEVLLAL